MEVKFYEDSIWEDTLSGFGYCSTLPGIEVKKQNPIGFIWDTEKVNLIQKEE